MTQTETRPHAQPLTQMRTHAQTSRERNSPGKWERTQSYGPLLGFSCQVIRPCASGGGRHSSGAVLGDCLALMQGPCPFRGVPNGQYGFLCSWLGVRFGWRRSWGLVRPPSCRRFPPFSFPGTRRAVACTHPRPLSHTRTRAHARLRIGALGLLLVGLLLSLEGFLNRNESFGASLLLDRIPTSFFPFLRGLRLESGGS